MLAVVTLLCVAICDHGAVHRLDAVLFLVIYIAFIAYIVSLVRKQLTADESKQLIEETQELTTATRPPRLLRCAVLVIGGVVLLTGGGHATVTGSFEIGRLQGLSERVIGLTIVAAGTGLPEVVTSLVSSIRGRDDIAIGNVIGSNLFNILGILGINELIALLPIAPEIVASDNWWMLGVTVLLFTPMYTGRRINRFEGSVLIAMYLVYMVLLLRR